MITLCRCVHLFLNLYKTVGDGTEEMQSFIGNKSVIGVNPSSPSIAVSKYFSYYTKHILAHQYSNFTFSVSSVISGETF